MHYVLVGFDSDLKSEPQIEQTAWEYFVYHLKQNKLICYWLLSHGHPWVKLHWKLPNLYLHSRMLHRDAC